MVDLPPPGSRLPGDPLTRRQALEQSAAFVAKAWDRSRQRELQVQLIASRIALAQERARQRYERRAAENEAYAEEAWLRAEAAAMLADGWTAADLREVGFSDALLRSLAVSHPG